ncbi:MAG TPA: ABC transporter permease [Bacteroidia bacterium]|nr:ABC transporter permease [Bacteroidia bacterium]
MFTENIKIALNAIKSNLLRSILTMLIIAIGITALVGILTAIDSIKQSINSNFTSLGANTFTVRNKELVVRIGRGGRKPKKYPEITYEQATRFKDLFTFRSVVSISTVASQGATVKYKSLKTNPNIAVFAGDENYLQSGGYELSQGRNFSTTEVERSANVVIIGQELKKKLFPKQKNIINEIVNIGVGKYKIVGVLEEKGASMGMGGDKVIIIPITNGRQYFGNDKMSYVINVTSESPQEMEIAEGEARGLLRKIRQVKLGHDDNFEIVKSDSLANILIDNIKYVTIAATIIGFITLLGAAIGLMNIMIVSVTERTREIGIRKSLGATSKNIRFQFLVEAVVICQLGGLLGIVLGIATGNVTSYFVGAGFIIPWFWILSGLIICLTVGLIAGIYPAIKASQLDPVEALRNE